MSETIADTLTILEGKVQIGDLFLCHSLKHLGALPSSRIPVENLVKKAMQCQGRSGEEEHNSLQIEGGWAF